MNITPNHGDSHLLPIILERSDPVNGGRPGHFFVEKRNSPKVMVFSGVKANGLFSVQNI